MKFLPVFLLVAFAYCGHAYVVQSRSLLGDLADAVDSAVKGATDIASAATQKGTQIAHGAIDLGNDLAQHGMDWGKDIVHNNPWMPEKAKEIAEGAIDIGKAATNTGAKYGHAGVSIGNNVTQDALSKTQTGMDAAADAVAHYTQQSSNSASN